MLTLIKTKNIKKEKILAIVIILFVAFISIYVYKYKQKIVYEVIIDNKGIGVIQNKSDIEEILTDIKNNNKDKVAMIESMAEEIYFDTTSVSKSELTSYELLTLNIEKQLMLIVEAYAINVNGKDIAILKEKDLAEEILSRFKDQYDINQEGSLIKEIGFIEDVKIQKKDVKIDEINGFEEAYKYIASGNVKPISHIVKEGDTLSYIAKSHSRSIEDIVQLNSDINIDKLRIGQEINITTASPLINVKTIEMSTYEDKIPFEIVYESSNKIYKKEKETKVVGKEGRKKVVAEITKNNGVTIERKVMEEEIIEEPENKVILLGTKERPIAVASGGFQAPTRGRISSRFGPRWGKQHTGTDFAAPVGTIVRASDGGKVTFTGWKGSYGKLVIIDHGNRYSTYYAHLDTIKVEVGQKVSKNQEIGTVGITGTVTGPNLHFEVRKDGEPLDPVRILNK